MLAADERKNSQLSYRKTAILVGLLFITSTITFSVGSSMIQTYFSSVAPNDSQLLTGVLLEVYTGLAVAGIGLAMLPILRQFNKNLAFGYLGLRTIECLVIILVGAYMLANQNQLQNYDLLIYSFTGLGGLILSYLLYISKLVPRWLSILGLAGYVVLLLGIPSDLSGFADLDSSAGALFYAPGGLFEIVLPLLLFVKGFDLPNTKDDL